MSTFWRVIPQTAKTSAADNSGVEPSKNHQILGGSGGWCGAGDSGGSEGVDDGMRASGRGKIEDISNTGGKGWNVSLELYLCFSFVKCGEVNTIKSIHSIQDDDGVGIIE